VSEAVGSGKMRNLYKYSLHANLQENVRQAVEEVERMDRRVVADPAFAGKLQEIVKKHHLEVAHLHKDRITAHRKDTEREVMDEWGNRRKIKQTRLDVTLPFSGDKESFLLSPSRVTLPPIDAEIGASSLTINILDDDNADEAVRSFAQIVGDNLEVLRTEYDQLRPQLAQAVDQAAQRRKQQIDAEKSRDGTRSFKIIS
jgi:hypothetical protein